MEKEFGLDRDGDIRSSGFVTGMRHLCGRTATIKRMSRSTIALDFDNKSGDVNWGFTTKMIEPFKSETIVIYRKGQEVIALDKTTGKKATAKCSPADEFDFETGAKLAFERLTSKVTFRALCVKECCAIFGSIAFKKGKVYEWVKGFSTREDGMESGHYESFKELLDRNCSYRGCLVELKDGDNPEEILKRYDKEIRVGDTVKIIRTGSMYTTNVDWIPKHAPEYALFYAYGDSPYDRGISRLDDIFIVKKLSKGIALVESTDYTNKCYLVGINGLQKVRKEGREYV